MGNIIFDETRLYEEIDNYGPIEYAEHNFLCEGLSETSDFEYLINEVRGILEKYERFGISSYPSGAPFLFWEQYINLRRNVGLACGLILVACFIATLFFLMDLWSAILLVCMLALISAEVFGVTGFLDIKFSSIPAIIIIASVGVAVEFTAPLTFYFLKASPEPGEKELSFFGIYDFPNCVAHWFVTRNERMHKALEHRFTPVFNGSVTTFLGIIMLAFAPLPFVRLYFFAILLSVVLLGMLNGLVLLPVVLSLVGPPAQVNQPLILYSILYSNCYRHIQSRREIQMVYHWKQKIQVSTKNKLLFYIEKKHRFVGEETPFCCYCTLPSTLPLHIGSF